MTNKQLNILIFCLARLAWVIIHCSKNNELDRITAKDQVRLMEESMQPIEE